MKIAYCREHGATKVAYVVGDFETCAVHSGSGFSHTDTGLITVADDAKLISETPQEYLDRIQTTYQGQFT